MNAECPWGSATPNLTAGELSPDEKLWLGRQICQKIQTPKQLALKYKLKRSTLYDYSRHASKRYMNILRKGRPNAFDIFSVQRLKSEARLNPDISDDDLRELLGREYKASRGRKLRGPQGTPEDSAKLSKKTRQRYRAFFNSWKNVDDHGDGGEPVSAQIDATEEARNDQRVPEVGPSTNNDEYNVASQLMDIFSTFGSWLS
jgi:hypothetical protein